jgi:cytochrome c oxidase subunit 2
LRNQAVGGWGGRLAKLALVPAAGLLLVACGEQANNNPTGDSLGPSLFGETSNGIGFPHDVVTTEGIASAGLYLPIFLIAVAIFVLIEGLLLFMAWRFRRRDKDSAMPAQVHGNNKLEIIWTAIPALVVTVLFVASAVVLADVESTSDEPAVVVDVEAFQFGWTFKYMDPSEYDANTDKYGETGVVVPFSPALASAEEPAPVMQEALLPVDVPIRFRLHSLDVIHSFYVPAFFFKRDVVPGRTNEFEITIEEPGVYGGQCAEFCGLSHGRMFFTIRAVEQADYDAWVAEKSPAGAATAEAEPAEAEPVEPVEAEAGEATEPGATPGVEPAATAETSEEAA